MKNSTRELWLAYNRKKKEGMFTAIGIGRGVESRSKESRDFFTSGAKNTSTLNAFLGASDPKDVEWKFCGITKGYPTKKNRNLKWFNKYYTMKIVTTGCQNPAFI